MTIEHLQANVSGRVSIAELANMAGLSGSHYAGSSTFRVMRA